jgi:hypothetical protein
VVGLQGSGGWCYWKTLLSKKLAEKAKEVNDIRLAFESAIITIVDNKGQLLL